MLIYCAIERFETTYSLSHLSDGSYKRTLTGTFASSTESLTSEILSRLFLTLIFTFYDYLLVTFFLLKNLDLVLTTI
jgi:hypothetical protein